MKGQMLGQNIQPVHTIGRHRPRTELIGARGGYLSAPSSPTPSNHTPSNHAPTERTVVGLEVVALRNLAATPLLKDRGYLPAHS